MTQITIEQAMQLALGHQQAGRWAEAIAAYRRAIALKGDDATMHCRLGLALQQTGCPDEAIAAYRRAIALQDDLAEAHNNLGNALWAKGRPDEAIAALVRAIELRPDSAQPYNNLGAVFNGSGRLDEAIAAYHRAIALRPDYPSAYNNLGNALWNAGRLDEARAALAHAIALRPDYADAYNNLGNVSKDQGRLDEALAAFRKACTLNPDDTRAASNLLFNLHAHPDIDAQALLTAHRRWASRHAAPLAAEVRPHDSDRTLDRRLRVGYVSPDFRDHAVGHLLLALFGYHDPHRVEIHAYADLRTPDGVSRKLEALAHHWLETTGLSDAQLAERIRADRIDILVDLALHTAGNRMLVFARKPAPVQVTMFGLPATTGLDTIDYRLTDAYLDPPGASDADYSEQSIRLPHCFWIFQPPEDSPAVTALPAERNGFITFGCLNQFAKVSPPAWKLWVEILQTLPCARLIIQAQPGSHRDAVRALFRQGGIAETRLDFAARGPRRTYLERFQELDLGLDPFPYNGHTSTLDALWMGVPVVTLSGRTAVGRGGVSILANLGLPELVARTPEEYVAIAVAWARDRVGLAALRGGLRQRMEASPLMNGRQFAADVEAAFGWMWKAWCHR